MTWVHSWKSLQTTFPTRAMEWFFALGLTSLGFCFWLTEDLFASNPAWAGMARYADQETWMMGCFAIGITRLAALMVNGLYYRTPLFRSLLAFISCFFWWQIGYGLIGNAGFAAAIVPWCFVFDGYNALRVGRESGVSEYVYRMKKASETQHDQRQRPLI